ncbi:MAG TPA: hypothetical protein VLK85_04410 [Ramlibacter sp.]|nr:hypothetical protein [Ramlibacter sp.]
MSEQGRTQELLLLGQIHGLVQSLKDGQDLTNRRIEAMEKRVDERFDGIDGRLRTVEQKAAVIGAASGGAMALGTALIVEGIKAWLGRHGG